MLSKFIKETIGYEEKKRKDEPYLINYDINIYRSSCKYNSNTCYHYYFFLTYYMGNNLYLNKSF